MKFTEMYPEAKEGPIEWFDPVLSIDTPLFIDPFLIYAQEDFGEDNVFQGSHDYIIDFFNYVYKIVAKSQGNPRSLYYKKALGLLHFPEVEELCLGYTSRGTGGSGSGPKLASLITDAIWEAVAAGIEEISHFEEIGILRENIGPDRISDITARLLLGRICAYTQNVCVSRGVRTAGARYPKSFFDVEKGLWVPGMFRLPRNRYSGKPIFLIPQSYIRELPTINAMDFWDYCYYNEMETLKDEFNLDISTRVSKSEIVGLARKHPDLLKSYILTVEGGQADSYDFERDPKGYIKWYDAAWRYINSHPFFSIINTPDQFIEFVGGICDRFKHYVEENRGWELLWNDDGSAKSERAAQLLFLGIVKNYCQANDIDITPEAEVGRGPVDFKVSRGSRLKTVIEAKLARNTKFWSGLKKQLPAYMRAEGVTSGFFVVIIYSDKDVERIRDIHKVLDSVNSALEYRIRVIVVDASRGKSSASKL